MILTKLSLHKTRVIQHPTRDVLFEKSTHGSAFAVSLMTKKRFDAIMRCWHFEDYAETTDEDRIRLKKENPFWGAKQALDA